MSDQYNQKFTELLMGQICEAFHKETDPFILKVDDFISKVSHPSDPDETGVNINGLGPDYIKNNLLSSLQVQQMINISEKGIITMTPKGKDYCNRLLPSTKPKP